MIEVHLCDKRLCIWRIFDNIKKLRRECTKIEVYLCDKDFEEIFDNIRQLSRECTQIEVYLCDKKLRIWGIFDNIKKLSRECTKNFAILNLNNRRLGCLKVHVILQKCLVLIGGNPTKKLKFLSDQSL